jgi:hypothetical protein
MPFLLYPPADTLCLRKSRRIQRNTNFFFQQVHDKDGTKAVGQERVRGEDAVVGSGGWKEDLPCHASVTKGGTAVKAVHARLAPNLGRRLCKAPVGLSFDITLHTSVGFKRSI